MSKQPSYVEQQERMLKELRKNNPRALPTQPRSFNDLSVEGSLNDFTTPYSGYRINNNPAMRHQQRVYEQLNRQRMEAKEQKKKSDIEKQESQRRIVVNSGINLLRMQRRPHITIPAEPLTDSVNDTHYPSNSSSNNFNNNFGSGTVGNAFENMSMPRAPTFKQHRTPTGRRGVDDDKESNSGNNMTVHKPVSTSSRNTTNARVAPGQYTFTICEKVSYYNTLYNLLKANPKWVEIPDDNRSNYNVDFSDYGRISAVGNFHPFLYNIIPKNKLYKLLKDEDFMPKTYIIHRRKFIGDVVPDPSEADVWFLKDSYRESAKGITILKSSDIPDVLNQPIIRHGGIQRFYVLQPEIKNPYLYYPNPVKKSAKGTTESSNEVSERDIDSEKIVIKNGELDLSQSDSEEVNSESGSDIEDWGPGHKTDMRFHVVVRYIPDKVYDTGFGANSPRSKGVKMTGKLQIWLYDEGYVHVSALPYDNSKDDKLVHVLHIGIQQNHNKFDKELYQLTLSELDCLEEIKPQVSNIIKRSIEVVKDNLNFEKPHYAVLGYDMLLDQDKKVWLIEINKNPGWTHEVSSQRVIDKTLIPTMKDFIKLVLEPIARSTHEGINLSTLNTPSIKDGRCGGFEMIAEYKI